MATLQFPWAGQGRRVAGFHFPRPNGWIVASVLVVGIGATMPVVQASLATSRGFDSQLLDSEMTRLEAEISLMEGQVAELTSLDRIERRAQEIGLEPAGDAIYVSVDVPGPEPAKIPAEYLPRVSPETDDPAPWWATLLTWLPLPN